MLARLLRQLQNQRTEELFTYSVVIVDNDAGQSARGTVEALRTSVRFPVHYFCEPEQNIALARNKAVKNAQGDFFALIDDDEVPHEEWLLQLYKTIGKYAADGILGPVLPSFESAPPQWVIKSRLCMRKSFPTGTVLENPRDTRSGNVLLKTQMFVEEDNPFNPCLGKTGGEDVDFFRRMMAKGRIFRWSNEAYVHETVPQDRTRKMYFIRRALLRGVVSSRDSSLISMSALKSVAAFLIYTTALPLLFIMGQHLFMRYLVKDCDHIGKLMALCGIELVRERSF